MRIDGTNNLAAQFRHFTNTLNQNAQIAFGIAQNQDRLSLSDIGKNLSLNMRKAPVLNEKQNVNNDNPVLNVVDKYMSKTKTILEQMQTLTKAAQNEKLSDSDRIGKQFQMEDLRVQLWRVSREMTTELKELFPEAAEKSLAFLVDFLRGNNELMPQNLQGMMHPWGDGSNMLQRAQNRIMNGEAWNVREVFDLDSGGWVAIDKGIDGRVLTVREKLEQGGTIVLMDAGSAAKGAKRLERQIETLQKVRGDLARISHEPSTDSGAEAIMSTAQKSLLRIVGAVAGFEKGLLHKITIPDYVRMRDGRIVEQGEAVLELSKPVEMKLQKDNFGGHVHADAKSERFRDWQPAIII